MGKFDVSAIRSDLSNALGRFAGLTKKIALYGNYQLLRKTLAREAFCRMESGGERITPDYFIEDEPVSSKKRINGKEVIPLSKAVERCKGCLILICGEHTRIDDANCRYSFQQLKDMHIEDTEIFTFWGYYYCLHAQEIMEVFDLLHDDFSKATYAHMVLLRMALVEPDFKYVQEDEYFCLPEFLNIDLDEVFVDCGAYVGDTIEAYLDRKMGLFKKIYAFEPMQSQYKALSVRVDRLKKEWGLPNAKFELLNAGIGDRNYQVDKKLEDIQIEKNVDLSAMTLSFGTEVEQGGIPVFSIDEFFGDQNVSLIKADIEGFELKMISGAEHVIKRDKPKLAVCIYHLPIDMFCIPLRIKKLCPDYALAIRQHGLGVTETVMYAYLENKLFTIN